MDLLDKSGAVPSLDFGSVLERLAPLICRQATNKLDVDGLHRAPDLQQGSGAYSIRGILSEILF